MIRDISWLRDKLEIGRGGPANIRCMEGMRGFAVFLVFLVHYIILSSNWLSHETLSFQIAGLIHNIGHTGVDLFFVLSGFLIYGSLIEKPKPFVSYLRRRLERIYPPFLAVLAIYLLLSSVFPAYSKLPAQLFQAGVYLLQNLLLLPGLFDIPPLISVAWSLSYEIFFYLTIPLLIALFQLRRWSPIGRATLFSLIAALFLGWCAFRGGHVRLVMFISGILLYETLSFPQALKFPNGLGLLGWLLGMVAILALPGSWLGLIITQDSSTAALRALILLLTFYLLGLDCFSTPSHRSAKIFSWSPIRYLGNMSYSYFLIHGLALQAIFLVYATLFQTRQITPLEFWIGLPLAFLLSLIPALFLYLIVERPYSIFPSRLLHKS